MAVLGSFTMSIVLQESVVPPIGSNCAATFWLPPAEVKVLSTLEPNSRLPWWIVPQPGALNGPPSGTLRGQVWVNAVTDPRGGGLPSLFR